MVHDDIVRVEVSKDDMRIFLDEDMSEEIVGRFKALGYTYITLDIQGYRMGSMNEPLTREGTAPQASGRLEQRRLPSYSPGLSRDRAVEDRRH